MGLFAWRRLREREALEGATAPSEALPHEAAEEKVVPLKRRAKRQARPMDDGAA